LATGKYALGPFRKARRARHGPGDVRDAAASATRGATTRLRKDAALCELPLARTGRRSRPAEKDDRLPSLAEHPPELFSDGLRCAIWT
jgi:hypothetical protein